MSEKIAAGMDFRKVLRRTKAMRGSYAVLEWDGYVSTLLTMAKWELTQVCEGMGIPQRPAYLAMERVPSDPESFEATPSHTDGPASVQVRWPEDGQRAKIDLGKLLSIYPFNIPRGARAYIPVERSANGNSLIFRFGKAEFVAREGRPSRSDQPATGQQTVVKDVVKALTEAATAGEADPVTTDQAPAPNRRQPSRKGAVKEPAEAATTGEVEE